MARKTRPTPDPKNPTPAKLTYTAAQKATLKLAKSVFALDNPTDCRHTDEAVEHLVKHVVQLEKAKLIADYVCGQEATLKPFVDEIEELKVLCLEKQTKLTDILPRVVKLRQALVDAKLIEQNAGRYYRHSQESQWAIWQVAAYSSSKNVLYRRLGKVVLTPDQEYEVADRIIARVRSENGLLREVEDSDSCC